MIDSSMIEYELHPLPKRELFDSKTDCYAEFTHGMLSGEALTAFCAAVDGE